VLRPHTGDTLLCHASYQAFSRPGVNNTSVEAAREAIEADHGHRTNRLIHGRDCMILGQQVQVAVLANERSSPRREAAIERDVQRAWNVGSRVLGCRTRIDHQMTSARRVSVNPIK
jgi:hypothetical protein